MTPTPWVLVGFENMDAARDALLRMCGVDTACAYVLMAAEADGDEVFERFLTEARLQLATGATRTPMLILDDCTKWYTATERGCRWPELAKSVITQVGNMGVYVFVLTQSMHMLPLQVLPSIGRVLCAPGVQLAAVVPYAGDTLVLDYRNMTFAIETDRTC